MWNKQIETDSAPTDGSSWIDNANTTKLVRGGSWYELPRNCRSASRYGEFPGNYTNDGIGFRVVCDAVRTK
ncbi:hypothetical protein DSM106972_011640 [Dulcicalothrix desertica PCC 7102]|uniref:Sulfatase-modifying factor enzyme-like domain-containing protein n=1 Tax=Dulcicalothrix desertica PCC 7102 TaxID=232991 RepID=A0A433VSQ6_9CYAN|nr:SUMF1/EgtB/PvdO family nonheme iron enzyme [Dulcicalothrix desertica]RUT09111.1 hypothetical protein DSM106972_011640 [Dulcicalothrix desertica PCC 7102]